MDDQPDHTADGSQVTRNGITTAGPAAWLATAAASEKMPAPKTPPMPIAVSCQGPSERVSAWPPRSAPGSDSAPSGELVCAAE